MQKKLQSVQKKLRKFWKPKKFVRALSSTKQRDWSSSCSTGQVVLKDTVIMEHDPEQFQSEQNPLGVGPFFGIVQKDGVSTDAMLPVFWCDRKKMPIRQTLTWLCPPVNKERGLRVKDPETGKTVTIYILGYTKRGVNLFVQAVPESKTQKQAAKTKKKAHKNNSATETASATPTKKRKPATPDVQTTPQKKRQSPRIKKMRELETTCHWRQRRSSQRRSKRKQNSVRRKLQASDSEQEADASDSEQDADDSDIRWTRFRRKPLTKQQRLILQQQVNEREQEILDNAHWPCFVDRCAREYLHLHAKLYKEDEMHLKRELVMKSAITTVANQVKPKKFRPGKGDMPELLKTLQPILELSLGLAGQKADEKKNTDAWIKDKIASGDISYKECTQYPALMDAKVERLIAECMAAGSPDGLVVLKPGEKPVGPEVVYTLYSNRVGRRRATASVAVVQCVIV